MAHVFMHQIDQIITTLSWGMEWVSDGEGRNQPYDLGGAETLGHVLSCWLVQVGGLDGHETAVGRDILFTNNLKSRPLSKVKKLILAELKDGGVKVING